MEEKYNVSLLAAGMHREAQQLIAEVIINHFFNNDSKIHVFSD
jgi:dynein heavy chain 1